jgi:hypothetical protein
VKNDFSPKKCFDEGLPGLSGFLNEGFAVPTCRKKEKSGKSDWIFVL